MSTLDCHQSQARSFQFQQTAPAPIQDAGGHEAKNANLQHPLLRSIPLRWNVEAAQQHHRQQRQNREPTAVNRVAEL
jgi:hypothetical protein